MVLLDTGCVELLTTTATDPEGRDRHGVAAEVCGLPLEAVAIHVLASTHGPVDHVQVQCPRGHRYTHVVAMRPSRRHDDDDHAEAA